MRTFTENSNIRLNMVRKCLSANLTGDIRLKWEQLYVSLSRVLMKRYYTYVDH
nr:hypothetical protein BC332_25842 [Ipomoea batatas]